MALLLLTGCDDFSSVQQADTLEAYEQYLVENPNNSHRFQAETRIQELYVEAARAERTTAAYDAYIERYPDGIHVEGAKKEREQVAFDIAWLQGDAVGWERFLEEHPGANRDHHGVATKGAKMAIYLDNLSFSEVRIEDVNLAEDPTGPLNGKGFYVDVTNNGTKHVETLWMGIAYLDSDGRILGRKRWPAVAPSFPTPIEEESKVPIAPGETRIWAWTTGDMPTGWARVAVVPTSVRLVSRN